MSINLPQLHMRRDLDHLPEFAIPAGYALRPFTEDDAPVLAALLVENAELGEWNLERASRYFAADSPCVLASSFFVIRDEVAIATAQLDLHREDTYAPTPELGWVAARPAHQGHGLGYVVCLAVMQHAAALGHHEIFLRTDDHRLPAIRTYLKLGFRPWLYDETAAERWQKLAVVLNTTIAFLQRGPRIDYWP